MLKKTFRRIFLPFIIAGTVAIPAFILITKLAAEILFLIFPLDTEHPGMPFGHLVGSYIIGMLGGFGILMSTFKYFRKR